MDWNHNATTFWPTCQFQQTKQYPSKHPQFLISTNTEQPSTVIRNMLSTNANGNERHGMAAVNLIQLYAV
jgi:hypothetical protein